MTGRYLIFVVAAVTTAGVLGTAVAQTPSSQNQMQNSQGRSPQSAQGTTSRDNAMQSRQTAQAQPFDPWHSKGHKLDNISDKLNACVLHPPEVVRQCIDYAITHPDE